MKLIEKEEEREQMSNPTGQYFHSCIVNLVIGTLYCEKGNYEFGISRVCKSLGPLDKKLGEDTWYYAKRCFLSMAENMAKQLLMLDDESIHDIIRFLNDVNDCGKDHILGTKDNYIDEPRETSIKDVNHRTIAFEARQLKCIFLKLTGIYE